MTDYIAGFVSGSVRTIVGQPLDTIKVWTQHNYSQPKTIANLYKGIGFPLASNGIFGSLKFGIYEKCRSEDLGSFSSGIVVGTCLTPFVSPVEFVKIRTQCALPVVTSNLYTGLQYTFLREAPAFGLYFYTYDTGRQNGLSPIVSGGLAGLVSWSITYPIDVVKTRIQGGIVQTFESAIRMGGLYRGISFCLFRGIIVNAVGLQTYDSVRTITVSES